jgi:hypothetical protein
MLIKFLIVAVLFAIVLSLASGLFHLVKDGRPVEADGQRADRAHRAVGALFILLFVAWYAGLITPMSSSRTQEAQVGRGFGEGIEERKRRKREAGCAITRRPPGSWEMDRKKAGIAGRWCVVQGGSVEMERRLPPFLPLRSPPLPAPLRASRRK